MENRTLGAAGGVFIAALCAPAIAEAAPQGALIAYIDPGAGSFILQAVVAALAGIIVTVNVYWRKIRHFLGFGPGPIDPDDPANSRPTDE